MDKHEWKCDMNRHDNKELKSLYHIHVSLMWYTNGNRMGMDDLTIFSINQARLARITKVGPCDGLVLLRWFLTQVHLHLGFTKMMLVLT